MTVSNPITMSTNETFEYAARWMSADGVPYDLSDARMQVRSDADSETVIVEASVDDGRITIEAVSGDDGGWARISIPDTVMATVTYTGAIVYDFLLTRSSDGAVKRAVAGSGTLNRGVTRG